MKIAMLTLAIVWALAAAASPVMAQTPAGSNIGLTEYPAPKCQKPVLDVKQPAPPQSDRPSVIEAEAYNAGVRRYNAALKTYNADMESFNSCITAYMANGNADMVRVQGALAAAVAMANAK